LKFPLSDKINMGRFQLHLTDAFALSCADGFARSPIAGYDALLPM
jgi:hypothetical protein